MTFEELIASITPETYENLKRAVELGKWPDGTRLTQEQREHCMQAVIAWGERHLAPAQRVGFIDKGSKAEGGQCASSHDHDDDHDDHDDPDSAAPVKFLN